jgi:hypothetical protein
MAKKTYNQITSVTLATTSSSVTFASVPQNFRDLILVVNGRSTGDTAISFRVNSDSGQNYPQMFAYGSGSSTAIDRITNRPSFILEGFISANQNNNIIQITDYSAADKHKTVLARNNIPTVGVSMFAGRWANNSPITNIVVFTESNLFALGCTFTLYGIEA